MTCLRCQHGEAKKFGKGRKGAQRYRCRDCRATFSERRPKVGNHYTEPSKAARIIELLNEGMSVRAVSRVTDTTKQTILALLLTVGDNARRVFDQRVRSVRPRYLQLDELWTFVRIKQGHLPQGAPEEWGDQYVWLALDSETKMILSYHIGKRDDANADRFLADLSKRVEGHYQLTTDGLSSYVPAVRYNLGNQIDFAQLIKQYTTRPQDSPDWYKAARFVRTIPSPISGDPDEEKISTSHVERVNLSVRTFLRRFTRLALGFSKSLRHLQAAVVIWVLWYDFARVHGSLRVTPAMESGLADHVWSVEELLQSTQAA